MAKLTSSYIIGTLLANDVDSMHVIGELLSVDVLEQLVQHSLTMEALEVSVSYAKTEITDLLVSGICSHMLPPCQRPACVYLQ